MTHRHDRGVRVGRLEPDHRGRVREILCATGAFRDDEVDLALELFDETFHDGRAAVAVSPQRTAVADYEFVGSFAPDGTLTGYACFGPTPGTEGTYDLYWIAVDPAHHRTGSGTRLLDDVHRQLDARGARLLVVETSSRADYAGTRAFYESRGYAERARIADFYDVGDHRVILTKRISHPPHLPPTSSAAPRPNPEFTRHE